MYGLMVGLEDNKLVLQLIFDVYKWLKTGGLFDTEIYSLTQHKCYKTKQWTQVRTIYIKTIDTS